MDIYAICTVYVEICYTNLSIFSIILRYNGVVQLGRCPTYQRFECKHNLQQQQQIGGFLLTFFDTSDSMYQETDMEGESITVYIRDPLHVTLNDFLIGCASIIHI